MAKTTKTTITSGFNSTTVLNNNLDRIDNELNDKVLYRVNPDGEPNQMENDLDMNSNDILNANTVNTASLRLGGSLVSTTALTANDASQIQYDQGGAGSVVRTVESRLQDTVSVKDFGAVGDGVTDDTAAVQAAVDSLPPAGGGIVFPQTSAGVYILSSKVTSGSKKVICYFIGETLTSTPGNLPNGTIINGFRQQGTETSYSHIEVIGDTVDQPAIAGSKVNGLKVLHSFGDSSTAGGRHAIYGVANQNAVTSSTNSDRNYVGVQGQVITSTGDGGTDLAGGAKGAYFGLSSIANANSGAANLFNITGGEINTRCLSGSSIRYKSVLQLVSKDEVNADTYDTSLAISKGGTGTVGLDHGILFGNMNGSHPVNAAGTLIGTTGTATVTSGIDFSSYSFTGPVLKAPSLSLSSTLVSVSGTNATIELGSLTAPNTPLIDFHSSGNNIDYDARIIASGGSATNGEGSLTYSASIHAFSNTIRPTIDNSRDLGSSTFRWQSTYSRVLRPGNGTVQWTSGAGTPEGVVAAPVGSMFTRTDGGAGTTLYVKESGSGNTGWVPK